MCLCIYGCSVCLRIQRKCGRERMKILYLCDECTVHMFRENQKQTLECIMNMGHVAYMKRVRRKAHKKDLLWDYPFSYRPEVVTQTKIFSRQNVLKF